MPGEQDGTGPLQGPGTGQEVGGGPEAGSGRTDRAITVGAYAMLFVFGVGQGVIGSFQYAAGPVPVAAIGFGLAIAVTGVLAGWGMRSVAGALTAGLGWLAAVYVLASSTRGGSVLITNSTAGKWFLYGGTLFVLAAWGIAFVLWSRPGSRGARKG